MIELVAQENSAATVLLPKLPALVAPASKAEEGRQTSNLGLYNCLISRVDEHLVVWDLGGGMLVNGVRMSKATVRAGDKLELGGVAFRIQHDRPTTRYLFGVRS